MADPVSITAMIVAVTGSIAAAVTTMHLKQCKVCACIQSDCTKTPPPSPAETPVPVSSPGLKKRDCVSSV